MQKVRICRRSGSRSRRIAAAALLAGMVGIVHADTHIHTNTDQRFHVGDTGTAATSVDIVLSCEAGDVGGLTPPMSPFGPHYPYIVRTPAGVSWNPVTPTIINVSPSTLSMIIGSITFPAPNILQVSLSNNFSMGNNFTLHGAQFTGFVANSPAAPLTASVDGGNTFGYQDGGPPGTIRVADNPTAGMAAQNSPPLSPGATGVAANTITVTESPVVNNGGIWAMTGIRITIPSGQGVSWNSAVTSLSGTYISKLTGAVTYEDMNAPDGGFLTAVIPVGTDFSPSDSAVLQGLQFNVTTSAPDSTGFPLGIRVGGASNVTAQASCGSIVVSGIPKLQSAASQSFTVGDLPAGAGDMTVTETSGSPKIVGGHDLQIIIPPGLYLSWDPASLAGITMVVTGTGALDPPTIMATNRSGDTLDFPVNTSFTSSSSVRISGAGFANFTGPSPPVPLELALTNYMTPFNPPPVDSRTRGIGLPSFKSSADQDFLQSPPGPATVQMSQITITDDAMVPRLQGGSPILIRIPAGFSMSWNSDPPGTAVLGGALLGATVAYQSFAQPNDTLALTPVGAFGAGGTGTVIGLNYAGFANPSLPAVLHMYLATTDPTSQAMADARVISIGGRPSISSGSNQAFTVNDPSTPANLITITDSPSSPSILIGNTLQIIIPPSLHFTWDTTVTSPMLNGSAKTYVTEPFSYSPDSKTLKIPVSTSFHASDTLTLSGLGFTNFTASCPPAGLQVTVTATGPVAATDAFTKAVGAPTLASAANQSFGVLDASTVIQPITITDDPVTPRLLAGNNIEIWIPASLDMTWNPAVIPTLQVTGGNGAVGSPSFANGNKELIIPITTSFTPAGPGQTVVVSGAQYTNFTGVSGPSSLEFFINGQIPPAIPNAFDSTSIRIGTRPVIQSVVTQDQNGNGCIDHLVVTFSESIQSTSSVTAGLGFTCAGYPILGGAVVGSVVTFTLRESGVPDTGATPALTYDPTVGNITDATYGLGLIAPIPATQDGAPPVIVGFTASDTDGNGFLNTLTFTFSEPLAPGPADINDWVVIDANGTTNLLAGLTSSAIAISGTRVIFTLANDSGTTGTPHYRYQWDGLPAGRLQDLAVPPNFTPTQTNNQPPIAVAGTPLAVLPTVVTLNGAGSSDPNNEPLTYTWTQVGTTPANVQGQLSGANATAAQPTLLLTTPGTYTFQLTVSDGLDSSSTTTTVTVLNAAPTAVAILNQVVPEPSFGLVTLYGFLSSDVDGDTPLTYSWEQVSGTPVTLNTPSSLDASFTPTSAGVYVFQLTVTDPAANSSTDQVTIRINEGANFVPTANAGPSQIRPVGSLVTLDGQLSTSPVPGAALDYFWTPTALLSSSGNPATPTFRPSAPGIYTFQLVVTDHATGVASAPSTVSVMAYSASNLPPVAVANKLSPFGNPVVGDLVTLDGSGSVDPEGAPLQYAWSQTAGPSAFISGLSTPQPTFTPVFSGTYAFQLVVSDSVNQSFPTPLVFQVLPTATTPPVELTPTLTTATEPTGHVLYSGTPITMFGSTFPPPANSSYTDFWWEQTLGPAVSFNPVFTGDAPSAGTVSFVPPVPGRYQFRLNPFNFSNHLRSASTLDVVVDLPGAGAPVANAGAAQTAAAGQLVTLDGTQSAAGAGGGALSYYWSQLSGPPVALSDPSSTSPSFTPPVAGIYVFSLLVRDGRADTTPSTVQITVPPEASSPTPTGSGGAGGGGCGSLGIEPLLLVGFGALALRRFRHGRSS